LNRNNSLSTAVSGAVDAAFADASDAGGEREAIPAIALEQHGSKVDAPGFRRDGKRTRPFLTSMPEIRRVSLLPTVLGRRTFGREGGRAQTHAGVEQPGLAASLPKKPAGAATDWRTAARRRRAALGLVVLLQTVLATWSLGKTFPYPWLNALEIATVGTFAVLFAWISFGFWSSITGLWLEWCNSKRVTIDELSGARDEHRALRSRTAILVPICNEDVERVFAGVEATYRSLAETGKLDSFSVFILSDTSDPDRQVEEELAWAGLCREVRDHDRIFYRHRRNNIKRKSGNIADFLRRWGSDYDYMVVFDADSVMTGEALVRLVHIMDRHPEVGIVQTVPTIVNRESLFARMQQFASRVYGPMLAAGAGFLQLGESYYWGHNAILRVAPFMKHCVLPRLAGEPPLGGEILSHDFVEAALMGRAGFEVWIVEKLAGSYEETPPSLQDELKRDRRWCQGNLQHARLMFNGGIRGGHRGIFVMGIMAYASALFWLVFLALSSVWTVVNALVPPVYFSSEPGLFPIWPQWHPEWAIALFSTTALLLFVPKFLSLALILRRCEARLFGGIGSLCASVFMEILLSALLAPIRMWFHAKFVVLTLLGRDIKWGAQPRADNETGWVDAIRFHGFSSVFALAWFAVIAWVDASFSWWLLPVAAPLILSIPLSVYSSRVSFGRRLRRAGLLLTPEETNPPDVVKSLQTMLDDRQGQRTHLIGLMRLLMDPAANGLHVALLRGKPTASSNRRARLRRLREKVLSDGPDTLTRKEKICLLGDAETMIGLHHELWRADDVADGKEAKTAGAHRRRAYVGPVVRSGDNSPASPA
jgi:membrane glycosyltransferase